jgi:hypothetical protein
MADRDEKLDTAKMFSKRAPIDARDDAAYVARLVAKMDTVRSETLA